jgi:RNA polymerase primary sigma factor
VSISVSTLIDLYAPLPDVEQKDLALRAQSGDQEARDRLILHSLRLVVSIIKPVLTRENIDDLFQEAVIGLSQSIDRFDPDAGTNFSTYATYWVRLGMKEFSYSQRKMFIPRYIYDCLQLVKKQQMRGLNRPEEIAEKTGRDLNWVKRAIVYQGYQYPSTDRLLSHTSSTHARTFGESIPDDKNPYAFIEEQETDQERKEYIKHLMTYLTKREYQIITLYYGIDCPALSTEAIAQHLNVSRSGVNQIRFNAQKKLRKLVGSLPLELVS